MTGHSVTQLVEFQQQQTRHDGTMIRSPSYGEETKGEGAQGGKAGRPSLPFPCIVNECCSLHLLSLLSVPPRYEGSVLTADFNTSQLST